MISPFLVPCSWEKNPWLAWVCCPWLVGVVRIRRFAFFGWFQMRLRSARVPQRRLDETRQDSKLLQFLVFFGRPVQFSESG